RVGRRDDMRLRTSARKTSAICTSSTERRGFGRVGLSVMLLALAGMLLLGASSAIAANPSANLDHCGNDPPPSPRSDGCDTSATQWQNGNMNESKSVYFEGDTIPYRMTFSNLAPGTHTVTIEWDTTKSGKHAIDYIDTFNQSVLDANPCLGVAGCNPS